MVPKNGEIMLTTRSNAGFFGSLITISCFAATALNGLSLQQGMDEVLSTHPIILERLHNYRATLEDLRVTETQYLPIVDYGLTIAKEKTKAPSTQFQSRSLTSYEHSLSVTQNLFQGFGTIYEADYGKARILAAANHYVENTNDIAYAFVSAYINALKKRDLVCIAKSNIQFNEDIYTKVAKLYEAGMTTRSEAEKADTSLSLAKSNYVVAQNNLSDALFNLERILGHKISSDELEYTTFSGNIPHTLEEMKQYASLHNPSVLVAEYNIKAAKYQREAAYQPYYPKIDAFVRQSWGSDVGGLTGNDDRFKMGMMLNYNLYRGGSDEAKIQKSLSKVNQEKENKHDILRKLDEQGSLSWSARQYLTEQIEHLKRYEATSAKTLELFQKEYDLGRRSLLDLIVAQNDHIASQTQIINAENDLLLAHYRVLDAMGSMVKTVLGDKADEAVEKVGLRALDNKLDNDTKVPILIFTDRQNGPYKRDTE